MKLPGLRLRLATSQLIRQWAQRRLPNGKIISGQILNPKTINYQTLKPEKDGLFCERIFGPIHDSICACGRPQRGQKFCPRCEVEYISTRVRRYRLGYIQLITATAHIWFFKGRPSYFSLFLNLSKKKIEGLLYCTRNISRTIFPQELSSLNFYSIQKNNETYLRNGILQNFIFGSFFSKRGYWNFKKIHHWKYRERRPLILRALELQLPRGTAAQRAPKAGRPRRDPSWCRPELRASGADSTPFCKVSQNCLIVSSNTVIRLMDGKKTAFSEREGGKASFGTNKVMSNVFLNFISSSILCTFFKKNHSISANFIKQIFDPIAYPPNSKNLIFKKQSRWQEGGLRDSAIYFGFSLVSKMFSWQMTSHWFSFVYFLIQSPLRGDTFNKFYPGPPGLVNFWGLESRLFCSTGVQLMRTWLTQLTQNQCHDGRLLEIQIRLDLLEFEGEPLSDNEFVQRILLFRRFKYLRSFRHTQMNPASMILSVLPVLPPDLRPILQLDNNQIAVSDLNQLYQTVLFRNKRLSKLTTLDQKNSHCLNSEALQYSQRLLQESVDSLIDNGKGLTPASTEGALQRPLKSLSDLFKGKKGRFRQNLLGKRVDYSGRSVIVVGPYLKIYECGLPKEIAYELFQPFLLRILMFQNQAQTILGAKKLLQQKPLFIWDLLKEVVHSHPILLNRAPSLHRLSIQAFQPRLIDGKAILLHPLVCAAFNADFDGDQMGVHLPLCFEARGEAWKITWSQNNLFSVATGSTTCSPSQDMILGSSFLTMANTQKFGFNLLKTQNLNKKNGMVQRMSPRRSEKLAEGWAALPEDRSLSQTARAEPAPPMAAPSLRGTFAPRAVRGDMDPANHRDSSSHLIKWLLFEKPFFLKNLNLTTSYTYFDKKNPLSETTLPDINIISCSKEPHPFIYLKIPIQPFLLEKNNVLTRNINDPIWCSYNPILNKFETEKKKQKLIEIRINSRGQFQKFRSQFIQHHHSSGVELIRKIRTTYGRIQFYESLFLFG